MTRPVMFPALFAGLVLSGAGVPPAIPATTAKPLISTAPAARPVQIITRRAVHARRPVAASRVATANGNATIEPSAAGFLNAMQVYAYADGAIYHVYAAPGRVTDIALQPGETLGAVASGDTVRWVIGDTSSGSGDTKRTHVLVKPFSAGLSTNLLITTDRRAYHVAMTSLGSVAMASLSWTYPQDDLLAIHRQADQAKAVAPVASGLAVQDLHFDYQIGGDDVPWRPLRAFDNGRQTFIEFPPSRGTSEAPPLFLIGAKGEANLVNYRVQGRYYVVDRLFDIAELRLGLKRQQVVRISRVANANPKGAA